MKFLINIFALLTFLFVGTANAKVSKPYAVFNPMKVFQSIETYGEKSQKDLFNYGQQGYEFVVEAFSMPSNPPKQYASLDQVRSNQN